VNGILAARIPRSRLLSAITPAVIAAEGLLVVASPVAALALALLIAAAAWVERRGGLVWWDMLVFLFGANLILTYGFANVGLGGAVPLPLTDVVVALLVIRALATGRPASARLVFALAGLYFIWATIRLSIDYSVWHGNALRDYTIAVEIGSIFVGYWAVRRYGLARLHALRWVMLVAVLYLFLYPVRGTIEAISPTVGLQQNVPLFGTYNGAGLGAAAALLFFMILAPFGKMSYVLAGIALAYLVLIQSRGLYVAVAVALFIIGLMSPKRFRIRGRLVAGLVFAVAATLIIFSLAPTGRLGRATPQFVLSQIGTLLGRSGTGSGSIQTRQAFYRDTVAALNVHPYRWVIGVGLGPDLSGGFHASAVAVRKPHDDYLEALGRLGVLGFTFLVGVIALSFVSVLRAARRANGNEGRFLWWITAIALVYMVVAATQPTLAYAYGTIPLFTLLGVGLALAEQVQSRELPHVPLARAGTG
jgi:O-Antigen ligase